MEEIKRSVRVGELGELIYEKIGMMDVVHPFVISADKIVTLFIYDLIGHEFINGTIINGLKPSLKFEIEPNDHIIFQLTCDSNSCTLKIYNVHVKTVTREYSGYDQEEIDGVLIDEVYHVNFERHRFRAFSVDEEAPQILRFVLSYLIPIDLPYQSYHYSSVQEIVQDLKKYFQS